MGDVFRFDGNLVQNAKNLLFDGDHLEYTVEVLCYLASKVQSSRNTLFSESLEYHITAMDFAKFSGRSKSKVYAPVDGFKKNFVAENHFGELVDIEFKSVLDYVLYNLRWNPLQISKVYAKKIGLKNISSASIGESILVGLDVVLSPRKGLSERVYVVRLNPLFVDSLVDQFISLKTTDLKSIQGNRKNSLYKVFLGLKVLQNRQFSQKLQEVFWTYQDVKYYSGISYGSDDESSNISKTVIKFKGYLNKILGSTSLNFQYRIDNNNFYFKFEQTALYLNTEDKFTLHLAAARTALDLYFDGKFVPGTKYPADEIKDAAVYLFDYFKLFSSDGLTFEREHQIRWYCDVFGQILSVDPSLLFSYYLIR